MPYLETASILQLTAGIIGLELALAAALLAKRGLFRWNTAGFWSWSAFLLYFVLSPLAVSLDALSISKLQMLLVVTGGIERAFWVLLMALLGIAAFFVAYLRTPFRLVTWRLPEGPSRLNPPAVLVLLAFAVFGAYSLLVFRAGLFSAGGEKLILNGRFAGDITGYQNGGYAFLFVPILLMLLSKRKRVRAFGGVGAAAFLILSLPHAWSRYMTVSFLLALSLVAVIRNSKRWPSWIWLIGLLSIIVLYQMRGHSDWRYEQVSDELIRLVETLPTRVNQILNSNDTAMLQTWYASSYLNDRWTGIDYGLPVLNYALTGWIPGRILPEKYFMLDWLYSQRNYYPAIFDQLLYGAKSSLLGSFYDHGGWVGVLLGCLLAGFLGRRMDGMLALETSDLVKSVGITWLSLLWMIWGSSTPWGMMVVGVTAMPALASWLFMQKTPRGKRSAERRDGPFASEYMNYVHK